MWSNRETFFSPKQLRIQSICYLTAKYSPILCLFFLAWFFSPLQSICFPSISYLSNPLHLARFIICRIWLNYLPISMDMSKTFYSSVFFLSSVFLPEWFPILSNITWFPSDTTLHLWIHITYFLNIITLHSWIHITYFLNIFTFTRSTFSIYAGKVAVQRRDTWEVTWRNVYYVTPKAFTAVTINK
jgi:hypothetical protein